MKKRILLLTLLLCGLFGCKYDDGPILDKVNDLEGRVSRLEVACGKLNQDLVALQKVVTLLQDNDYVTSVTPLMEQGQQVGYTLTFAKGGPVSIRDGKNGLNGKDGTNPRFRRLEICCGCRVLNAYFFLHPDFLADQNLYL